MIPAASVRYLFVVMNVPLFDFLSELQLFMSLTTQRQFLLPAGLTRRSGLLYTLNRTDGVTGNAARL
jgi:hypothetical protein